jgi:DNA-binding transcriptional ArsR family regulator
METQLRAIADPVRFRILKHLANGESAAGDIARKVGRSGPVTSHHLAILRDAGLVQVRREAQARIYSLDAQAVARFRKDFDAFWDDALPRLKTIVEADHGRRRQ